MHRRALLIAPLLLSLGCADEPAADATEQPCPPRLLPSILGPCVVADVDAIGALVAGIEAGGDGLIPVSAPFPQQHGNETTRQIYASHEMVEAYGATVADLYRLIDPSDEEQVFEVTLPPGAMFVHYSPEGGAFGTLVKLPPGSAPADNDWFMLRYDVTGQPDFSSYGDCHDCHDLADRPTRTDFLWGVPRSAL